ncbi:MAG: ATP-binding cassette domain-containing protein [Synergistaceae bacterium]|jgi:ABC-2 type transport system ATP-binding protein|nr:ATP-binding cassette domain-containing protein [Synergistaceae bacterium]
MGALIEAEGLSFAYAIKKHGAGFLESVFSGRPEMFSAVKDMNFSIKEGELVTLAGPGGAGKSTLIKMILGILAPVSGKLSVMGADPFKKRRENALKTGVVFGFRSQLWWDLPLGDSFTLLGKIYRVPEDVRLRNIEYAKEHLDIGDLWNQPVRQLRPGQRMAAEVGAAIQHGPKLLVLDEPLARLDAAARRQILEFIKRLCRERGTAVIMSTRDMKDAEDAAARVLLIDGGCIVADSPVEALRQRYRGKKTIKIGLRTPLAEFKAEGAGGYPASGGLTWNFEIEQGGTSMGRLIDEISGKAEITSVTVEEERIEDIINDIYISGLDGAADS